MTETRTAETFSRAYIVGDAILTDAGEGFVGGFLVEAFAAELTRRGWAPILESAIVRYLDPLDLIDSRIGQDLDPPPLARVAIVKLRAT